MAHGLETMNRLNEEAVSRHSSKSFAAKGLPEVDVKKNIAEAVGEVGIFGVLAVLHDQFGPKKNLSKYETWPIIQGRISQMDNLLHLDLDIFGDPIDEQIANESSEERFEKHGIIPLSERDT